MAVSAIRKVGRYLRLLNKAFEFDEQKNIFRVKEKIDDKEIMIIISFSRNWVTISHYCGSIKDLPKEKQCEIYRKLLRLNNDYAEVSFSIDEEGNIFSSEEILVDALTLDVFMEEYNAIPISAELFEKEIKPLME